MIKSKPVGPAYERALRKARLDQDWAIVRGGFPVGHRCSEGPHTPMRPHVAGIAQASDNVRVGDVICHGHAVPGETRHEQ